MSFVQKVKEALVGGVAATEIAPLPSLTRELPSCAAVCDFLATSLYSPGGFVWYL